MYWKKIIGTLRKIKWRGRVHIEWLIWRPFFLYRWSNGYMTVGLFPWRFRYKTGNLL